MLVGDAGCWIARMIDQWHAESLNTLRNRLADPAHADDADSAVAKRSGAEAIILLRPAAFAHIAVGVDEFPQRRNQQPYCRIGDLISQHVRRKSNDNVVFCRIAKIDMVVADAKENKQNQHGETR